MNEPDAVEPAPPGRDPVQTGRPGYGYALAQARVRAGLSVEQAAVCIRLHPRQLQAIENEDLAALPAAAYIHGFIRNYARELKIDPAPLLEDFNAKLKLKGLDAASLQPGPLEGVRVQTLDERGWRHLVLAGIVVALVFAGLIGAWIAHSRAREADGATAPPPVPAATGSIESPAASVAAAAQTPSAAGVPAAATAPGDRNGTAARAANGPAAAGATAQPPAASPAVAASAGGESPAGAATAPGGQLAAAAVPDSGPPMGRVLRFNDRSWVEVSQPNGRVLLSRNGEPGTIELLNTLAPLVLVVGRADAVQVEYHGQPVNLKPYANSKGVARLTLADGRVTSGGPNNR